MSLKDDHAKVALGALDGHAREADELLELATRWIALGRRSGDPDCIARAEETARRAADSPGAAVDALIVQGGIAEARGDLARAEELYRQALLSEPKHVIAHNNLAYVLSHRPDRCVEALALIDAALALSPEQPDLLDTLSQILLCLNRTEEAEQALVKAASSRPEDLNIALNLAEARLLLNRLPEARLLLDEIERRVRFETRLEAAQVSRLEALKAKIEQAERSAAS